MGCDFHTSLIGIRLPSLKCRALLMPTWNRKIITIKFNKLKVIWVHENEPLGKFQSDSVRNYDKILRQEVATVRQ